ncbi:hypothetical protein SAMN02745975_00103 [Geosporobacter subterraneus DSM 17957]|uniref:Uncharacterized protein n=1 Tax=Geosporobacter subterraneus DSM 17957 TaxID=1121919 RepID=A0A1M6BZK0_9FIRM|nr:hypothetical protein [Geosporobacter subterraneus]SHI53904.1 hypothetical protein SAMN02745975_00103 [Geosporobacter subterraneus DSM 17957]
MPKENSKIKIVIQGQESIKEIQYLMIQWTAEKYQQLLESLNEGKVPAMLFNLLEEEVFQEIFGKTKQELEHLKIKLF